MSTTAIVIPGAKNAALKTVQNPEQVFKVASLDNRQLAVAIAPVAGKLNLKAMASACKAKKPPWLILRMSNVVPVMKYLG